MKPQPEQEVYVTPAVSRVSPIPKDCRIEPAADGQPPHGTNHDRLDIRSQPTDDAGLPHKDMIKLRLLCLCLGFGQGCAITFYVGAGGYYVALFANSRFLIYMCAFLFLPPMAITVAALLFDTRFNITRGVRVSFSFRIYSSCVAACLFLTTLCVISCFPKFRSEGVCILFSGIILGIASAIMLSSFNSMFGAVCARLAPIIVFGQTVAGVFTNVVAWLVGFKPGCAELQASAYWVIALASVAFALGAFIWYHYHGLLEYIFQWHEDMLASGLLTPTARTVEAAVPTACSPIMPGSLLDKDMLSISRGCTTSIKGISGLCWAMAMCQAISIAMNNYLTPRANQIAQGNSDLTQRLVLNKLLADFVGRSLFFIAIPTPRERVGVSVNSIYAHVVLVGIIFVVRIPMWIAVFLYSVVGDNGQYWMHFLADDEVLVLAVWLPFIALGALINSWCFFIATTSAKAEQKANMNLLMTCSIYLGYVIGVGASIVA